MSYFGVSLRNGASLGLGTVPALSNPPLLYRLAPSLLLQFAGAETLDSRVTFTRTTTATRTNSSGLIESVAINGPRFDYNPTTLAPKGLLIEEQRVNLVTYSEQFDNAAWTKQQSSVTANTVIAPDGTLTGDVVIQNTANNFHGITGAITVTVGTTYAWSVFAKAQAATVLQLTFGNGGGTFTGLGFANFDLSAGTVSSTGGTLVGSSIQAVGNGWYRCFIAATATTTAASNNWIAIANSTTSARLATYTGDGTSGIYIWGAQLEVGAFSTSYIPTVASQVTRTADVATMTGTNFSSWYNATEGTLFAEWNSVGSLSDSRIPYAISDGTFNNVNYLTAATAAASNQSVNSIRSSNTLQAQIAIAGAYTNYAYRKSAAAYKVNDFAVCGDGGAVVVDTSGSVPVGVDRLALGTSWIATTNFLNGTIKRIAFYPRRLTNAELQAITS